MTTNNTEKKGTNELEGEGSYTAARRYDAGVQKQSPAETQKLAKEAEKAIEGPEGDALRKAEKIGKTGKPAGA